MATLKEISSRLKAVTNIQKITKSMKMVSAAKFARAERELKPARSYGHGALSFFDKVEVETDEKKPNHLVLAMTSDRGLCGGVHSAVSKSIKADIPEKPAGTTTKIICVGDKSRAMLSRIYKDDILMHFTDIGKKPAYFGDAAIIANQILNLGYEYNHAEMYYNIFKTVVSYNTSKVALPSVDAIAGAGKINLYDSIDEDVIRCYNEFAMVSLIFFAMKEGAASEQSQRMTAMDAATKNAGEMIDKLRLTYNRTRQAVITTALIEIISGAAAL